MHCSGERTVTIAHSALTPTADMVTGEAESTPSPGELHGRLRTASRRFADAPAEEFATVVLGQPLATNVVLLGFAYQHGAIPIDAAAIEAGIGEVHTAAETNLAAFRLGRVMAVEPGHVESLLQGERVPAVGENGDPNWAHALYGAT